MDNVARLQDNYFRWKFPCYGAESFLVGFVSSLFVDSLLLTSFFSFFFTEVFGIRILETGDMVSSYVWRILNIQNKRREFSRTLINLLVKIRPFVRC